MVGKIVKNLSKQIQYFKLHFGMLLHYAEKLKLQIYCK